MMMEILGFVSSISSLSLSISTQLSLFGEGVNLKKLLNTSMDNYFILLATLSILMFVLAGMAWLADWLERKYPHG